MEESSQSKDKALKIVRHEKLRERKQGRERVAQVLRRIGKVRLPASRPPCLRPRSVVKFERVGSALECGETMPAAYYGFRPTVFVNVLFIIYLVFCV